MLKYLRTRNRQIYGAVISLIRAARKAPAIMPALAELVDYIKIESRREALIQVRRELRHGTTAEQ